MAARDVAQALRSLASAARGVAANTEDPLARNAMLDCTGDVMDKSASLIEETKRAIAKPGDPDSQQRLAQVEPLPQLVYLIRKAEWNEFKLSNESSLLIADGRFCLP